MSLNREEVLTRLNAPNRLECLAELMSTEPHPACGQDVNNHIHTIYSFSPYSPTAAVWFARQAGLCTCGLMDHDSISGAEEFLKAAHIAGIAATIGVECRVSFANTPFAGRHLNNQDQASLAYIALHGIPHNRVDEVSAFFAPRREMRNHRNREMVLALNNLMRSFDITIDFDRDVLPLSEAERGGSVTERHIACALAARMMETIGTGKPLVDFIKNVMKQQISARTEAYLLDEGNPFLKFDLIAWIKSTLLSQFYIDAEETECPDVRDVLALSERIGAVSAYAYLGDVMNISTADKRNQRFEDEYLDELVPYLRELGFRAVTYMPFRNTRAQLERIRSLCEKHGLFQISGEDINSPRQPFVCEAQRDPAFRNLYDAAWALIAHERRATADPESGLFSERSVRQWPNLHERITAFSAFGQELFAKDG